MDSLFIVMNYNILTYAVYVVIMIYIIVWVGKAFHHNGSVFIHDFFPKNTTLAETSNNLLLVGYYLFNIGYAVLQVRYWRDVDSVAVLIASVARKIGLLLFLLTVLHYNNILMIYLFSQKKTKSSQF